MPGLCSEACHAVLCVEGMGVEWIGGVALSSAYRCPDQRLRCSDSKLHTLMPDQQHVQQNRRPSMSVEKGASQPRGGLTTCFLHQPLPSLHVGAPTLPPGHCTRRGCQQLSRPQSCCSGEGPRDKAGRAASCQPLELQERRPAAPDDQSGLPNAFANSLTPPPPSLCSLAPWPF